MRFKVDDGRLTRTGAVTVYDSETGKPLLVTSVLLDLETASAIAESAAQLLNSQHRLAGWEPSKGDHLHPDIWERQEHEVPEEEPSFRYYVEDHSKEDDTVRIWDSELSVYAITYNKAVLPHALDKAEYECEMMNDRLEAGVKP